MTKNTKELTKKNLQGRRELSPTNIPEAIISRLELWSGLESHPDREELDLAWENFDLEKQSLTDLKSEARKLGYNPDEYSQNFRSHISNIIAPSRVKIPYKVLLYLPEELEDMLVMDNSGLMPEGYKIACSCTFSGKDYIRQMEKCGGNFDILIWYREGNPNRLKKLVYWLNKEIIQIMDDSFDLSGVLGAGKRILLYDPSTRIHDRNIGNVWVRQLARYGDLMRQINQDIPMVIRDIEETSYLNSFI